MIYCSSNHFKCKVILKDFAYDANDKIGEGSFGEVYKGYRQTNDLESGNTKEFYAIKKLKGK